MSYQFSTDGASGAAILGILNKCFVQIFVDVEYKKKTKEEFITVKGNSCP